MRRDLAPLPDAAAVEALRVLIVDDDRFFGEGLCRTLEADGISVVGETPARGDRVASHRAPDFDLVMLDLGTAGPSVPDAIAKFTTSKPSVRIVAMGRSDERPEVLDALVAGACGYLRKDSRVEDLVAGVWLAAAGYSVLSSEIVHALASEVRAHEEALDHTRRGAPDLTARELDVIRLLTQGADNASIGRELSISPNTVKQHVTSIFGKLGVQNRVQAAVAAVRAELA